MADTGVVLTSGWNLVSPVEDPLHSAGVGVEQEVQSLQKRVQTLQQKLVTAEKERDMCKEVAGEMEGLARYAQSESQQFQGQGPVCMGNIGVIVVGFIIGSRNTWTHNVGIVLECSSCRWCWARRRRICSEQSRSQRGAGPDQIIPD